jgi:hypothetical protein
MFAESVRLASFQQSLSDRDPWAGGQIYCRAILQNPSTLLKQRVDLLAREIFRRLQEARKLAEIQPSERGNPGIDPKSEATAAFRRAIRPCDCAAQLVVFVAIRFANFLLSVRLPFHRHASFRKLEWLVATGGRVDR